MDGTRSTYWKCRIVLADRICRKYSHHLPTASLPPRLPGAACTTELVSIQSSNGPIDILKKKKEMGGMPTTTFVSNRCGNGGLSNNRLVGPQEKPFGCRVRASQEDQEDSEINIKKNGEEGRQKMRRHGRRAMRQ